MASVYGVTMNEVGRFSLATFKLVSGRRRFVCLGEPAIFAALIWWRGRAFFD